METDEPALEDGAGDAAAGVAVVYRDDREAFRVFGLRPKWKLWGLGEGRAGCDVGDRDGVLDGIAEAAASESERRYWECRHGDLV